MNEPQHFDTSRAWSWRHAIGKSKLPPTTRLVLHTLGLKMDATGGSCYPSVAELVELTGLDKKTVLKHLELAAEKGWIEVSQHGFRGQKWKRNEYVARWPGRDLRGTAASLDEGERGGVAPPPSNDDEVVELTPEGGGIDSQKVVEPRHQDKNIPENIPENIPLGERASAKSQVLDDETDEALWKRAKALEMGKPGQKPWPAALEKTTQSVFIELKALSPEERRRAEERRDDYLAACDKDKKGNPKCVWLKTYLKERKFDDLPAPKQKPTRLEVGMGAPPFGPDWSALRNRALLAGAEVVPECDFLAEAKARIDDLKHTPRALTPYLRIHDLELDQDGVVVFPDDYHAREFRRLVRTQGYPFVNRLDEAARGRRTFAGSAGALAAYCEAVPVGSSVFEAWREEYERRNWQWIPDPGEMRVVYFPRGGPPGLDEFEAAIRMNSEAAE